ncbi:MAG: glycoside hydrolase family 9 protein [Bacteroidales bacterium]|nr:glycoside hydrolase family 9 protein [Bacteroidales bacterium]
MKKTFLLLSLLISGVSLFSRNDDDAAYTITDKEYFTNGKVSVLVQHNNYYVGRCSGIEIIQHGERILTNGGVAMLSCAVPDPKDVPVPQSGTRFINVEKHQIGAKCLYPEIELPYSIAVENRGNDFVLSLYLDAPIADSLNGKIDFIVELYPEMYKGKSYFMDAKSGIFPNQFDGAIETDGQFHSIKPLSKGKSLVVAPELPLHSLKIKSDKNDIELIDARGIHEHKWFVVRSVVPAGITGKALEWVITPASDELWKRQPRIAYSQIGYHPRQRKIAYVELDSTEQARGKLELVRLRPDGTKEKIKTDKTREWGRYLCYNYCTMDFSKVREEGLYQLVYGDAASLPFPISNRVYNEVWKPTLETFLCVQMCHMAVKDRIRNWHGICHNDDAVVPPANLSYLLGYQQRDTSDTPYKSGEHVPGVNVGGWHDAGDNQVPQGVTSHAVHMLTLAYEEFRPETDQTTINQQDKQTLLHVPDGKNDFLQQIEHGVLNLLAGYRIAGHAFIGTICSSWEENLEIGSPGDNNDGIVGTKDDRYVFTNKSQPVEYNSAATLAAAARVLKDYDKALATECLTTAEKIWNTEKTAAAVKVRGGYAPSNTQKEQVCAAVELFLSTRKDEYKSFLLEILPELPERQMEGLAASLCRVAEPLGSETFKNQLKLRLAEWGKKRYKAYEENPFFLPPLHKMFGSLAYKLGHAANNYFLHKTYPDLFDDDYLYRTLHYTFGCHAVPDRSFVSGVGIKSLTPGFGFNRSDFSYIPGGVTCGGTSWIQPDFPEFKENDPYLWLQTEYTVGTAVDYIFCVLAADHLLKY